MPEIPPFPYLNLIAVDALPLLAGFLAAFLHVISGPDHLAAVTPLVMEEDKGKWKIGWWWGWGHLSGMLLIGIFLYFIKDIFPLETFGRYSEKMVGALLIILGIWVLSKLNKSGNSSLNKKPVAATSARRKHYAFGFGVVHGFAGVSHFVLMLPVLAFGKGEMAAYMAGFAAGTVSAMTSYAFLLGRFAERFQKYLYHLRLAGGLAALIVGIWWLI